MAHPDVQFSHSKCSVLIKRLHVLRTIVCMECSTDMMTGSTKSMIDSRSCNIQSTSGFVDDASSLHSHNRPESETIESVSASLPGGGTKGEVCCLRLRLVLTVERYLLEVLFEFTRALNKCHQPVIDT